MRHAGGRRANTAMFGPYTPPTAPEERLPHTTLPFPFTRTSSASENFSSAAAQVARAASQMLSVQMKFSSPPGAVESVSAV